jgi:hypothetical protein
MMSNEKAKEADWKSLPSDGQLMGMSGGPFGNGNPPDKLAKPNGLEGNGGEGSMKRIKGMDEENHFCY